MSRYKAYAEYKDSGVEWLGHIPSHWYMTKVRFVSECLDGKRIPLNASERGDMQGVIPYWGANSIVDYVNDWLFDEDLVLIGEDGAPFFDRTKSVAFNVSGKVWPNNHVHVLRPNLDKINPRFLTHALNCVDYHLYITGSTRDKLNQSDLNSIFLRVCSLHEQEQIANFLDHETAKIDILIAKQQELIKLLKEKRQAVISHAVTKGLNPNAPMRDSDVEWLGEVPAHWDVCLIKFKCNEITDGAHVSPTTEGGVHYFVSITDIKRGVINFENALLTSPQSYEYLLKTGCRPNPGDILFSKDGTIGQTAITPSGVDFVVASSLIIIRPNQEKVTPTFLDYLLQSDVVGEQVESFVKGAALRRLSIQNLLKVCGSFPPLDEQVQITEYLARVLDHYDELEANAIAAIGLMQERRTALISAAVTGKIDVREVKISEKELIE